jgi:hypothetical protein
MSGNSIRVTRELFGAHENEVVDALVIIAASTAILEVTRFDYQVGQFTQCHTDLFNI